MRLFPMLFFFGLSSASVWAQSLIADVRPDDKPGEYILAVKNAGPGFLHVVGRKSRAESFVSMSFTLRGKYLAPTHGGSEKPAPYLLIETRLVSGDRMLHIHPVELAKVGSLEASYEDFAFIFVPGQEYRCKLRLPHPPMQVDVRYVDSRERRRMLLTRWRAR